MYGENWDLISKVMMPSRSGSVLQRLYAQILKKIQQVSDTRAAAPPAPSRARKSTKANNKYPNTSDNSTAISSNFNALPIAPNSAFSNIAPAPSPITTIRPIAPAKAPLTTQQSQQLNALFMRRNPKSSTTHQLNGTTNNSAVMARSTNKGVYSTANSGRCVALGLGLIGPCWIVYRRALRLIGEPPIFGGVRA